MIWQIKLGGIDMDLSTKVFNKFKDGSLPWLELDMNFKNPAVLLRFIKIMINFLLTKTMPSLN